MKKKTLPLRAAITMAWPENNFLSSILQVKKTGYDWLMNTHIQIYGSEYKNEKYYVNERRITFYPFGHLRANVYDLCPFIRKYVMPRSYIKKKYNYFSDFVIEAIDADMYINTRLFESFRTDFQFVHPCYIYGYDRTCLMIDIADNLENNKYVHKKITFSQLNDAFDKNSEDNWDASVFMYQLLEHDFKFSSQFAYDQTVDYLVSGKGMCYLNRFYCPEVKYTNNEENGEVYLGIEAYKLLYRELENAEISNNIIDLRSFAFVVDHKKMMCLRDDYLRDKGIAFMNYKYRDIVYDMQTKSKCLLNILIKFNMKLDVKLIEEARKILTSILEIDRRYMDGLEKALRS